MSAASRAAAVASSSSRGARGRSRSVGGARDPRAPRRRRLAGAARRLGGTQRGARRRDALERCLRPRLVPLSPRARARAPRASPSSPSPPRRYRPRPQRGPFLRKSQRGPPAGAPRPRRRRTCAGFSGGGLPRCRDTWREGRRPPQALPVVLPVDLDDLLADRPPVVRAAAFGRRVWSRRSRRPDARGRLLLEHGARAPAIRVELGLSAEILAPAASAAAAARCSASRARASARRARRGGRVGAGAAVSRPPWRPRARPERGCARALSRARAP